MEEFCIKDLETFSGIKAHTIRMWEQRYGILVPQRSKGNYRFYSLEQVRCLLNISLMTRHGIRISKIAALSTESIRNVIKSLSTDRAAKDKAIFDMIYFMFSIDVDEFEFVLDNCVHLWGIANTIEEVILPFIERVGLLSYSDSSCTAHFVVTAIRKKIILGIETITPAADIQKKALLFLPEKEHYDLILLYIAYRLKSMGLRVLYLGTNISATNLQIVISKKQPDLIYTYIPPKLRFTIEDYLAVVDKYQQQPKLVVVKPEEVQSDEKENAIQFSHYRDIDSVTKNILNTIRA